MIRSKHNQRSLIGCAVLAFLLLMACAGIPQPTVVPTVAPITSPEPTLPAASPDSTLPRTQPGAPLVLFSLEEGETQPLLSAPGAGDVLAELAIGARGISFRGDVRAVDDMLWMAVEAAGQEGWLPAERLVEETPASAFCGNEAVDLLVADVMAAISLEDGPALSSHVSPTHGLYLRHNMWNTEVWVAPERVAGLFEDTTVIDWGVADGSGKPILGDFSTILLPDMRETFTATNVEVHCNNLEAGTGPTAGLKELPYGYQNVNTMIVYRPAGPDQNEFDWTSFALGVEMIDGQPYLLFIVMYQYEI